MKNYSLIKKSKGFDAKFILKGLKNKAQKRINSKYFYDEIGSKLFDMITNLDEYYPTRKELSILSLNKDELKNILPRNSSIIEFGSGSLKKISKLVDAIDTPKEYFPIDISEEYLLHNAKKFSLLFPEINTTPICADFNHTLEIRKFFNKRNKLVGFFPGSTIGNSCPVKATLLLKKFADILKSNNYLIIGVDLKKTKNILEKAYNDSKGVTAKFNQNILCRLNKEFEIFFEVNNFAHLAFFNEKKKRIEMHLQSKLEQEVKVLNSIINFKKGETIHTENSYKYSIDEFIDLMRNAGYVDVKYWTDEDNYFGVFCFKVK